ncbi:MAG TPA: CPBP family intramembrane glutamic endopeptidase [Phycisphaerales bacterium]|nr:CPBP family intramembrane glutamic endopeptidase [Phycisphaerales bacterium]
MAPVSSRAPADPHRRPTPVSVTSQPKAADDYWHLSTRPLHILAFLLPLLFLYEVGTLFFLSGHGVVEVVRARVLLAQAFDVFGQAGFHLPPVLLAAVLLVWHMFSKDPLRVRTDVVIGMAAESFLWTIPLLVFAMIAGTTVFAATTATSVDALPWTSKVTLALGAGIYEELVFRLVLISLVHAVLVDAFKMQDRAGFIAGALVSALAFTFYHNLRAPDGGVSLRLTLIYFGAGVFFSTLFIKRGFGVAVATHALYDLITLLVLAQA